MNGRGTPQLRHQAGLTLVEMVIVMAIIGILATLALPNYQAYLYRAKAVEIVESMHAVKLALVGAEITHGGSIGEQLLVSTDLSQSSPLLLTLKGQSPSAEGLPGVDRNILDLQNIGIQINITAGHGAHAAPGEYLARLYWNSPQGRQTALAAVELLQPQLLASSVGSSVAELQLSLHGAQASTSPTAPTGPGTTPSPPQTPPVGTSTPPSTSTTPLSQPPQSSSSQTAPTVGTSHPHGHGNSATAPGHTGQNPGHGGTPPGHQK